jgi:Tol biopolymer transport system component
LRYNGWKSGFVRGGKSMRLRWLAAAFAALLSLQVAQAQINFNPASDDLYPQWSPDGSRILFQSSRTGEIHLFSMNADGSDVRQLTDSSVWNFTAAWSPDGTQIAFASRVDTSSPSSIYVMNADGSGRRLLSDGVNVAHSPTWSPDGTRILYRHVMSRPGQPSDHVLVITNADGSGDELRLDTPFWNAAQEDITMEGVWSPDGTQIALSYYVQYGGRDSDCYNDGNLYLVSAQTGAIETVINGGGGGYWGFVGWLDTGTLLVRKTVPMQCLTRFSTNWYLVDVVSRTMTPFALQSVWGLSTGISIAPDNQRLAYLEVKPDGGYNVVLSDRDLSSRQVVETTKVASNPNGIDWSPDGSMLVFSLCTDTDADVFVYSVATGQTVNLTASAPVDSLSEMLSECGTLG